DRLVVERVINVIAGRTTANIGGHFQVETDGLANTPFPVKDADHGVDLEVANVNNVHRLSCVTVRSRAVLAPLRILVQSLGQPDPSARFPGQDKGKYKGGPLTITGQRAHYHAAVCRRLSRRLDLQCHSGMPPVWPARSAHRGFAESRCHQRHASWRQAGRTTDIGRRCTQGRDSRAGGALAGTGSTDCRAGRLLRLSRSPAAGVLPVSWRQGCGHGVWLAVCAALAGWHWHRPGLVAGVRHHAHLLARLDDQLCADAVVYLAVVAGNAAG